MIFSGMCGGMGLGRGNFVMVLLYCYLGVKMVGRR